MHESNDTIAAPSLDILCAAGPATIIQSMQPALSLGVHSGKQNASSLLGNLTESLLRLLLQAAHVAEEIGEIHIVCGRRRQDGIC